MTIYILVYSHEESKRLKKVVLVMSINADREMINGKPKRLPKQILCCLLPKREDQKFKILLNSTMKDFINNLRLLSRYKALITSPPLS